MGSLHNIISTFIVCVATLPLVVNGICCFPERLEGEVYSFEEKETSYIAYDFGANRLLKSSTIDDDKFQIIQEDTGASYQFERDGTCRFTGIIEQRYSQGRCMDESLLRNPPFFVGGPEQRVEGTTYTFRVGITDVTHVLARAGGDTCYPMLIYTTCQVNRTLVFSEVQPTVSTERINVDITGCQ